MKARSVRRLFRVLWFVALVVLTSCRPAAALRASAGDYPRKTIVLICPWAPGGGTDRVSRFWADALSRELGQPVVVVNKTGGSGAVGHTAGAYARPDGYTLAMITFELSTMHRMGITDLTYRDFACVMQVNGDAAALLVRNDAPWEDLGAFLDEARARPGRLKMSGTAAGGAWDLARAGLQLAADVPVDSIVWVPTKGAAPSLKELLGGHIDAVCCSIPEAASQIAAGQLRVLAVMSEERHPDFPDLPTAKESGVPWVAVGWRGLAMPTGTPAEIVDLVSEKCRRIAASDEYQAFMQKNGFGIIIRPKEAFAAFLRDQDTQWERVIEAAGYQRMDNHDPGPHFFPTVLVVLLGCFAAARFAPAASRTRSRASTPSAAAQAGTDPRLDWRSIALLTSALIVYVVALSWLGFTLSTLLFSVCMMRWLGNRWWVSLAVSIVLVSFVRLLFVVAFQVPLPAGELGLPF